MAGTSQGSALLLVNDIPSGDTEQGAFVEHSDPGDLAYAYRTTSKKRSPAPGYSIKVKQHEQNASSAVQDVRYREERDDED